MLQARWTLKEPGLIASDEFSQAVHTLHGLARAGRPALLLGAPGSGKTTMLTQVVSDIQGETLDSPSPRAAVLIRATEFGEKDSWLDRVAALLQEQISARVDASDVSHAFASGSLVLAIDGLDEMSRNARDNLSTQLVDSVQDAPVAPLLLASRSIGAPKELASLAETVVVPPLDPAAARQFFLRAYPRAEPNLEVLYDLSGGNPLLLRLLGENLALRGGLLPIDRAAFLRDAIEGLLVVLVERILVNERERPLSLHQVWRAHEELAFRMLTDEKPALPRETARAVLTRHLSDHQVEALLRSGKDRALLIEGSAGEVNFSHRLMAEFFAASFAANDPGRLQQLATLVGSQESVALALSLTDAPALALVALAETPGLSTLERLRPLLSDLPRGALDHAREILTERTIAVLSSGGPPSPPANDSGLEDEHHSSLLRRWLALEQSESYGYERGLELELFMVDFFGRFFGVVEHDYRTEIGQIDLLLENIQNNPFWLGHNADIPVECKNTRDLTEQGAINMFAGKLASSPATLSFFVSQAGFTPPAWARLRSAAQNREQTTIVPITGDRIRRTLEDGEEAEHFFKARVRNTVNLQLFPRDS